MTQKVTLLILATLFCCVLAFQYPLQTTFPIGGDATRYIARVQQVNENPTSIATNSHYPGAVTILSASQTLPISWPERFTWLMVLGQLATAGAMGWLLRKKGAPSAAAGIAIWGLTIFTTNHFGDGTLAQLWSLPFLILAIERLSSAHFIGATIFGLLAFAVHPLSGLILVMTALISLIALRLLSPSALLSFKRRHLVTVLVAGFIGIIAILSLSFKLNISAYRDLTQTTDLANFIKSFLGPFVLLAPAGLALLLKNRPQHPGFTALLLGLTITAVATSWNNLIGLGIFPHRFVSYLAIAITLLSAYALPEISRRAIPDKALRISIISFLFVATGAFAWIEAARTYHFNEDTANYARPHPKELETINWLKDNHTDSATFLTTKNNRYHEWLPILTQHQLDSRDELDPLWHLEGEELTNKLREANIDYVWFLINRERPRTNYVETLPVAFETKGNLILQVHE